MTWCFRTSACPGISGLEFMQQARKNWPDKKFYSVAITDYAAEEDTRGPPWPLGSMRMSPSRFQCRACRSCWKKLASNRSAMDLLVATLTTTKVGHLTGESFDNYVCLACLATNAHSSDDDRSVQQLDHRSRYPQPPAANGQKRSLGGIQLWLNRRPAAATCT